MVLEMKNTLFIVAILIIAIWVIIELKRFKHKIFAILLIMLILFTYISFTVTISEQDIDFKSVSGITKASKLYLSWLGSMFGNIKSITSHAIKMDWGRNKNSSFFNQPDIFE